MKIKNENHWTGSCHVRPQEQSYRQWQLSALCSEAQELAVISTHQHTHTYTFTQSALSHARDAKIIKFPNYKQNTQVKLLLFLRYFHMFCWLHERCCSCCGSNNNNCVRKQHYYIRVLYNSHTVLKICPTHFYKRA